MVKFPNFNLIKVSLNYTYLQCVLRKTIIFKSSNSIDKSVSSCYHEYLVLDQKNWSENLY